ncbi:hypothetical protein V6N11_038774 [Hibiscus sabdariffa]|uniref:Uncharacterized protein n=1 Tax=Hibiscus sabdariffa TaxID=183260 RepID=A0ABR2SL01_9ROSI
MNRLWEDNMIEDWRVLELPNAESGEAPRFGQVGEVGNAMIMAEVGEPGLEIPIEVLGPSERSMELIDVGPRGGEKCFFDDPIMVLELSLTTMTIPVVSALGSTETSQLIFVHPGFGGNQECDDGLGDLIGGDIVLSSNEEN